MTYNHAKKASFKLGVLRESIGPNPQPRNAVLIKLARFRDATLKHCEAYIGYTEYTVLFYATGLGVLSIGYRRSSRHCKRKHTLS
jgi:hypothetical protein